MSPWLPSLNYKASSPTMPASNPMLSAHPSGRSFRRAVFGALLDAAGALDVGGVVATSVAVLNVAVGLGNWMAMLEEAAAQN